MPLRTRLTERFGIEHPILSAPMGFAAGGALAAAVSRAGGLGLIGGGYGDQDWLDAQFAAAGNQQVGCGFITWSLAGQPHLLTRALERQPRALMLSFGDPLPFAEEVRAAGSALICQMQTLAHARRAIEAGADVLVAQGAEAGRHGAVRGTLTLVPEVRDLCARCGTDALVLAAGGIVNGRGLAAALMLGADGVLVGTCLYAAEKSLVIQRCGRPWSRRTGIGPFDQRRRHRPPKLTGHPVSIRVLRNRFMEAVARHGGFPEGGAGGCSSRLRCCRSRGRCRRVRRDRGRGGGADWRGAVERPRSFKRWLQARRSCCAVRSGCWPRAWSASIPLLASRALLPPAARAATRGC